MLRTKVIARNGPLTDGETRNSLGVLAHSTHLRGAGVMQNGVEKPNVRVTLASKICAEDSARLNLGYLDPTTINIDEWKDKEDEGRLYVPKAGELLYRLKTYCL